MKGKFTTGMIAGGILGAIMGVVVYSRMNESSKEDIMGNGKKIIEKTGDFIGGMMK
ncbi:MAG: hypothetical protein PHP06_05115 [Clostridia bacterium]|nr:hypothetical protein [Clostridia bacterium]